MRGQAPIRPCSAAATLDSVLPNRCDAEPTPGDAQSGGSEPRAGRGEGPGIPTDGPLNLPNPNPNPNPKWSPKPAQAAGPLRL